MREKEHRPFYNQAILEELANGMVTPFLPVFALALGATETLIGLQAMLPTIFGNLSQLYWAKLTERTARKKMLVIVSGVLWALFWIPIAYSNSPYVLIALLTIQAIVADIGIPAWTMLLIETTPSYKRNEITAELRWYMGIGSLLSTLAAGFILKSYGFIPFVFFIACALGLISRLAISRLHEPRRPMVIKEDKGLQSFKNFFEICRNPAMKKFLVSMSFLNFAVGLAGPLTTVYVVKNLGGSTVSIAVISVVTTVAQLVSYRAWGWMADYIGKRKVMLCCLVPIGLLPFWYYISPSAEFLYLFAVLNGLGWGGFYLSSFAYLSEVMPKEAMSRNIAVYNIATTFATGTSNFLGGYIADITSIRTIFLASVFLRLSSIALFEQLGEGKGFNISGFFSLAQPETMLHKFETFTSTYLTLIDRIRMDGTKLLNHTSRKLSKGFVKG